MWSTFDSSPEVPRRRGVKQVHAVPDAVTFARTRLGFVADEKQASVLLSTASRGILNCSRQWGKSTVTAVKAVHRAYTRPGCLVLVACPSERQSAEFLRKASGMVRRLKIKPQGDGTSAISLLLPNGSRIVGLPGVPATVRGFSAVSLILIDEAAWVRDDMYRALRPMLAVGDGDLWLMSTPGGKRGFFYEAWVQAGTGGKDDWFRVSAKATECPRIAPSFLEKERAAVDGATFSQEYMCEFVGDESAVFAREAVEAALDDSITELNIGCR